MSSFMFYSSPPPVSYQPQTSYFTPQTSRSNLFATSYSQWSSFQPKSPSPLRSKNTTTAIAPSSPRVDAIVEEPQSLISGKSAGMPVGSDPLSYRDDRSLLDSSSEEDDSSDEEADAEVRVKKAKQQAKVLLGRAASQSESRLGSLLQLCRSLWTLLPNISPLWRGVFKCVTAYFLASLFTYNPTLSSAMAELLPHRDHEAAVPFSNLHLIATVAVYFHPARTFGSMLEADLFALAAFLFSVLLTTSSMLVAEQLHDSGHPRISNAVSCLLFLGVGMSLIGWAKVKMGKPTFNTACSLVSVLTFTVFVKEGSVHLGQFETDKIWQVSYTVIAGTLVSNLVCFAMWPQTATSNLRSDMSRALDAYSTLLRILTRSFLLDDPSTVHFRSSRVRAAISAHHSAYSSLQKNLAEARYEAPFDARIRGKVDNYREIVSGLHKVV